jgi:hypothetical protein
MGSPVRARRSAANTGPRGPERFHVLRSPGDTHATARWLESFVVGVTPRDAATLSAVSVLFLCVTVVAAYAPARRASHIDPTVALRTE